MSKISKILSLMLCFILVGSNLAYADTVMIGQVPTSGDKAMTQSGYGTTYLQNQLTGPGTLPSSANTLGTSPIQSGVTIDYSAGIEAANIDDNGVGKSGPTASYISSPAANNAMLATSTGQTKVITNSIADKGTHDTNTSDTGPKTQEILAPSVNGPRYDGNTYSSDPMYLEPTTTNINTSSTNILSGIPSYSTQNTSVSTKPITTTTTTTTTNTITTINTNSNNSDFIVYQVNDNIAAVKPNISSGAAIVVNATTRQIYYSKGGFTQYAPAGLANLVTAYLLLTYKGLDNILAVSSSAVTGLESGATTAKLRTGNTIIVKDALAALFVNSSCDVANVVAENVSGSIPAFVSLMNQTVKNWGCIGTTFTNPSGLNSDAQVTNVYDMAIIMDKVTQNPTLKLMLSVVDYTLPATVSRGAIRITSKNALLTPGSSSYYNGIVASRMGYTSKAKYTMTGMIEYNGQRLIAVVLRSNGTQFTDITKLLNYGKVAYVEASMGGGAINTNATSYVSNNIGTNVNANVGANVSIGTSTAGDTPGTWMQDSKGWYFVKSNGTYANNEWIKQNGKMYCVDSAGYMITGWREFSNGKTYYFDIVNGEFRYNTWVNVSTGAYYLQADGSLATADRGTTKNIITSVGTYTIDENGKAIAKVN